MKASKVIYLWLPILAAVLATGCGRMGRGARTVDADYSAGSYLGATSGETQDGYICPGGPNVLPQHDIHLDGTDRYTVCKHSEDTSKIKFSGTPHDGEVVCVFPAEYVDATHVYTKPDAQGLPTVRCYQLSEGSFATAQFTLMNYNALFIVDQADVYSMRECMITGQFTQCPSFSFGRFR